MQDSGLWTRTLDFGTLDSGTLDSGTLDYGLAMSDSIVFSP
jgi:hypothetical protein